MSGAAPPRSADPRNLQATPIRREPGEPPAAPPAPGREAGWINRLWLLGVALPVLFIVLLGVLRVRVFQAIWPGHAPVLFDTLLAVATAVFGVSMVAAVRRTQAVLLASNAALARAHEERLALESRLVDDARHTATVAERDRIAREMHDSLAQALGVAQLRLTALADRPEVAALPDVRDEVEAVGDVCRDAYRDVREAILGLRERPGEEQGLLDSLDGYVAKFSRQAGLPAHFSSELDRDPALTPHAEIQAIRVVQEALTNARKHARAHRVTVTVRRDLDRVLLEVADDGRGFEADRHRDGDHFGLRSMRERSDAVGGRLTVRSHPGQGTRVVLSLPEEAHA